MGFGVILKNGYNGDEIKLQASSNDTVEMIITKATSIWTLPDIPHTVLDKKRFVPRTCTLIAARIPSGTTLEIVPDPMDS